MWYFKVKKQSKRMYFRKHGKGCLEAFCTEEGCKLQLHLTWTKVLIPTKSSAVSATAPSAFSGCSDIPRYLLFLYFQTVKDKLSIPKPFSFVYHKMVEEF